MDLPTANVHGAGQPGMLKKGHAAAFEPDPDQLFTSETNIEQSSLFWGPLGGFGVPATALSILVVSEDSWRANSSTSLPRLLA
jgi:hypothetical protein